MIEVAFSSSFKRVFKKKIKENPELENRFWERLNIFINDPFDSRLRTHKLSGKLRFLWSFSVEYDVRVIFTFEENKSKAILENIGTHDEVY